MPPGEAERTGELLIEEGVVTQEDVSRILGEGRLEGSSLAAALESATHVRRSDLAAFLATDFRIPALEDLRHLDFPEDAARLVPEDLARKHEMVVVALAGGVVVVAKPNYFNRAAVQELRRATGLKVKVVQADADQVRAALEKVYRRMKGELPPPKPAKRPGSLVLPAPTSGSVEEAELAEMALPVAGPAEDPVAQMREAHLEEVVEILEAVRVPPQDFAAATRDPMIKLVVEFDEIFRMGKVVPPYRVL